MFEKNFLSALSLGCISLQGTPVKDIKIPDDAPSEFLAEKHFAFIQSYESEKNQYVREFIIYIWFDMHVLTGQFACVL